MQTKDTDVTDGQGGSDQVYSTSRIRENVTSSATTQSIAPLSAQVCYKRDLV
jgi:hypothetical protein